jgi:hypothetical protein
MSEKIKELKKQCRVEKSWDPESKKWVDGYFDEDKFARLIINESAKAIELEVNNWRQLAPFNNIILHRGINAIKQHFGI